MQCDMTSLGRPCIAPGNDLHTCTVCTLRFHHLCAGGDSGWDKCPACVSGSGAAPVQRAGPSSGAALAVAGDGRAAPAAAVSGGQRCAPAPAAVNTWQGFWAAKVAAPPARPRAANKQVPAKAPGPAAARAAAAEGPEAVVSFLASVPVEQHATARERIVPINDGGARKRKSGASGGASGVDDEDKGGCRRLRQDLPHAPVQQPAWLWPPAPLVHRGHHSTAGWRRATAEKMGRKRRI